MGLPEIEVMEPDEQGWSEWIHPLPGYLMQCCDCRLVHEMEVAIVPASEHSTPINEGETQCALVVFRMRRHADQEEAAPEIQTALVRLAPNETHTADEDGAYVITGAHTHSDILRYVAADVGADHAIAILEGFDNGNAA